MKNIQDKLTKQLKRDIIINKYREDLYMLLEFSCSNHKSIKNKIVFSAIAGKDNTNEEYLVEYENYRILKNAVIYGANGSGKSNFIDAVLFVKYLVTNSIKFQPGDIVWQSPHKLLGINNDSEYNIQFITNGVRFSFGFTLRNSLIVDEYLFYFPRGRRVKIYERDENDFTAGDKFKGKFDSCKNIIKPNRLFLSCAANFSSVKETEVSFLFFRDKLVIYRGFNSDNWMKYSLKKMYNNPAFKDKVIYLINKLGADIKDIKIKISEPVFDKNELLLFLPNKNNDFLTNKEFMKIEAKVVYDAFEVDLMEEESTGIKKLFEFICPVIDIISKGKILICDELESNFHESIVYSIVNLFVKTRSKKIPQLFFTTHDTSILKLDLLRRDQIWFTELDKNSRSTDLYSLAEIKNVRKDENIEKGYISGKYGAIPMLNENLANVIMELL